MEKNLKLNNLKKIAQKYLGEKTFLTRQFSKPFTYQSLKILKAFIDNKNEIGKFTIKPTQNSKSIACENKIRCQKRNFVQNMGSSINKITNRRRSLMILSQNLLESDQMNDNLDDLSSYSCSCPVNMIRIVEARIIGKSK